MKSKVALIFGYNDYALEIAKNIKHNYKEVYLYSLKSQEDSYKNSSEFEIRSFDLSDKWGDIDEFVDFESSIAFCVLEDSAENIFLTISLRSVFQNLNIIALSNNKETANKLKMAGANRVIPLVQTTAEMISEMMEKPIVKEVFHNILFENSDLKITQIKMYKNSIYLDKKISDLDWERHGIIALSIVLEGGKNEFIYASKIKNYTVKEDDVFVVVGYERDILEFEKRIGSDV